MPRRSCWISKLLNGKPDFSTCPVPNGTGRAGLLHSVGGGVPGDSQVKEAWGQHLGQSNMNELLAEGLFLCMTSARVTDEAVGEQFMRYEFLR